jgi:hypothetical protein
MSRLKFDDFSLLVALMYDIFYKSLSYRASCILDILIFLEKCTLYAILKKFVRMNVAYVVEHIM